VVSPSGEELRGRELAGLKPGLTAGEWQCLEMFNRHLIEGWEIYVQPYLNGLRPDFVLLNEAAGVVVVEVKDWTPGPYANQRGTGSNMVVVSTPGNPEPIPVKDPVIQAGRYRSEILDIYCTQLGVSNKAVDLAGSLVILPSFESKDALQLLLPKGDPNKEGLGPVSVLGLKGFDPSEIEGMLPVQAAHGEGSMNTAAAKELQKWLIEPEVVRSRRDGAIRLDARQEELAKSRTKTGLRRIRGPAGSGKTVVLAARAAYLQEEAMGRNEDLPEILVPTFNHTLRNYIRDVVVEVGGSRLKITWLGFHEWCKRVITQECGSADDYPKKGNMGFAEWESILISATVAAIESNPEGLSRYDAILIDEGQDLEPERWAVLMKARRDEKSEVVLVADPTQDLYRTGKKWTDQSMKDAGFSGPWNELGGSHRIPEDMRDILGAFIESFGIEGSIVPTSGTSQQALRFLNLRWSQVDDERSARLAEVLAARRRFQQEFPSTSAGPSLGASDLTILATSSDDGKAVVRALKGDCTHTFGADSRLGRQLKKNFHQESGKVKVATVHSFKGWESPALILVVSGKRNKDVELYTALSRLSGRFEAFSIEVICSVDRYAEWARANWPEFVDLRSRAMPSPG
jgi:hypothetical protein